MVNLLDGILKNETMKIKNKEDKTTKRSQIQQQHKSLQIIRFNATNATATTVMVLYPSRCIVIPFIFEGQMYNEE